MAEDSRHRWSTRIGGVRRCLMRSEEFEEELERLYSVEGFDEFALGLMWLGSASQTHQNGRRGEVMDYQAELLGTLLERENGGGERRFPTEPPPRRTHFKEALHRFGHSITLACRHSLIGGDFRGCTEDHLQRILQDAEALCENARSPLRRDVVRFCGAFSKFLEHVMERKLFTDNRTLRLMESANMTLQTVVTTWGHGGDESLERTIVLLERPELLFT